MSHLLNWLITYIQRLQLIQFQSDEQYSQITKNQTIFNQFKKFLQVIKFRVKAAGLFMKNLSGKINSYNVMLLIGLVVAAYILFKKLSRPPPRAQKKQSLGRSVSRVHMPKKNSSLLSIKQYESHSNSQGNQSDTEQIDRQKLKQAKKVTKEYKQFCTDIETEPHGQYQSTLETKRDKFFFNLIGSYQSTGKNSQSQTNQNEQVEEEYKCLYQNQQHYEGQNEMSPHLKIALSLKMSRQSEDFALEKKKSERNLQLTEKNLAHFTNNLDKK